jgi:cytochrome c-type biogenesis protein CcmH
VSMRDWRRITGWAVTVVLAAIVVGGLALGNASPEDRVASIGAVIRCPVCQGEAIIDSPAETAAVMMDIVEEKVAAGETDQQIIQYFEERYGAGILLDPPFAGKTIMVWIAPLLALGGGIWMILSRRRKPDSVESR